MIMPIEYNWILSAGVGGNSGKSSLAVNLVAFLSIHPGAKTLAINDLSVTPGLGKNPGTGLYDCFFNIFGCETADYVDGCEFIRIDASKSLVAIRAEGQKQNTWDLQIGSIKRLSSELSNAGHEISHVISESNLPPAGPSFRLILHQTTLKNRKLRMWITLQRDSIANNHLYEQLNRQQEYSDPSTEWNFVINPYPDIKGRDSSGDLAPLRECFKLRGDKSKTGKELWLILGKRAAEANSKGLQGADYWEYVVQDIIKASESPKNLLAVYRRSEDFFTTMSGQFASLRIRLNDPVDLGAMLDDNSDGSYSEIYEEYFKAVF